MTLANPTARELFMDAGGATAPAMREQMERNFFHRLRLPNGTAKTTFAHRLDDVAGLCNGLLSGADAPLRLMDIGISSGVTTAEWMEVLERLDKPYRIDAVDLSIYGVIESLTPRLHVLRDSHGRALQFELAGRALANHYGWGPRSFVKRALPVSAARAFFAIAAAWQRARGRALRTRVPLLARGLRESSRLALHEADVLQIGRFRGPYHLIRAANVLNRAYFRDAELLSIVAQLRELLHTGSYLVVVRTEQGGTHNDGSVFRKNKTGELALAERLGGGSELEHLVQRLNAGKLAVC